MSFEIKSAGFDDYLRKNGDGLTIDERKKVNKVGAKIYENAMQTFLDHHRSDRVYQNGTEHLADTLTHEITTGGKYEIGFSKKGKKAYIARLLNDGFDVRNQFGGPYKHVAPEDWNNFIANIGKENDARMGREMSRKAQEIVNNKNAFK